LGNLASDRARASRPVNLVLVAKLENGGVIFDGTSAVSDRWAISGCQQTSRPTAWVRGSRTGRGCRLRVVSTCRGTEGYASDCQGNRDGISHDPSLLFALSKSSRHTVKDFRGRPRPHILVRSNSSTRRRRASRRQPRARRVVRGARRACCSRNSTACRRVGRHSLAAPSKSVPAAIEACVC
jgi:hypothetical protein